MSETMQQWFGLGGDHRDFSIETEADRKLFFTRHEIEQHLKSRLARAFRTESPPKMVLYGDWGAGKTHTMRHLQYEIEKAAPNSVVVFVELPDITKKATFQIAHAALLDALGVDRAKGWLMQYQTIHQENTKKQIQELTQSGDIAIAFANLVGFGEASRIAWDWLRGVKLSATDARMVNLPPALDQSGHMVKVLQMFGKIAREVDNAMVVLMLDEATKLDGVKDDDSEAHWTNAFKLLADDNNKDVGIIVSISVIDLNDLAEPLHDQQVMSRFGHSNYVRLNNLSEDECRDFISHLVQAWVDDEARTQISDAFDSQRDGEMLSTESFPFTAEGLATAANYAAYRDSAGYTTPRDIQKNLDDLLNRAMDEGRHILSAAWLSTVVNA
jgi:Cdc6-like AAA superfamily ATPase